MQSRELIMSGISPLSTRSRIALERVAKILAFVCFTSVGAQLAVRLPFTPVPVTMQTLFVILAGVTLGARDGCYAMLSYLALGLSGVPVFAELSFGPAALLGPTGGYLVSFPAAALAAGSIAARLGSSRSAVFVASICGAALILLSGTVYLAFVSGLSFSRAALIGIAPFAAGDLVKALIVPLMSRRNTNLQSALG